MLTKTAVAKDKAERFSEKTIAQAAPPAYGQLSARVTALCILALVAINVICYYRTFQGYFLADDFIHINYLASVFDGNFGRLLENFSGNWMQAQGTQFYRPLITLTLALDYFLGRADAAAFHYTNTLYQIASTIFLFLLSRRLLAGFSATQSNLAAMFAAALFAAHPLHPEVVSWVIGRVDSVCTTFYLSCFYFFVRWNQKAEGWSLTGALVAFALSLMSKEMAVTVPATLFAYILFAENKPMKARLADAARVTAPFWALLAAYFAVRYFALGTFQGGYGGSIGEGLSGSLFKRWFQDGAINKIFYPLNIEVFASQKGISRTLSALYLVALSGLALRLTIFGKKAGVSKMAIFAALWFAIAMLPTYQVFNISDTLQCSRFIYLGTAPLCLMVALLALPLFQTNVPGRKWIERASVLVLAGLVGTMAYIAQRNNLPWIHASNEARAFRSEVESAVKAITPDQNLVVLNIPHQKQGAHMLYNAAMMGILLSPPLTKDKLTERVFSFEPMTFGDPGLLNVSRLRRLATASQKYKFYRWSSQTNRLMPLAFTGKSVDLHFVIGTAASTQLSSPPLSLPVLGVDFIDVTYQSAQPTAAGSPQFVSLSWTDNDRPTPSADRKLVAVAKFDGRQHRARFNVSERKEWIASALVKSLEIDTPAAVRIEKISVLTGKGEIPSLAPTKPEGKEGLTNPDGDSYKFQFDASAVPQTTKVLVEVSKSDAWFNHYSNTYRDKERSARTGLTVTVDGTRGTISIPIHNVSEAGYHEVRILPVSASNRITGYASDPIQIQITAQQLATPGHE